ncbi:MAG: exopolyphosphatase [Paracoccaceae bacterium]
MIGFANKKIEDKILQRTGIVDIGSNTIRLVVFEGPSRSPRYFYNEKVNCELGIGLRRTGYLSAKGQKKAFKAIQRFNTVLKTMNIVEIYFVATSAVRDAKNGKEFIEIIEKKFKIKIYVISGKDEGVLAASGVLLGVPKATGIVCDIGGSSLELAYLENGKIKITQSFELGPLALQDYQKIGKSKREVITKKLSKINKSFPSNINSLFLVGGCWRAMAKIHMNLTDYPLKVLQGYKVLVNKFDSTIENISNSKTSELLKITSSSEERVKLLPDACKVLKVIYEKFCPKELFFSGYGIREGIFFSQFSDKIRKLNPLLQACSYLEQNRSRYPGFGRTLYEWLLPIFPEIGNSQKELFLAACYLHDTIWQAHPDYRSEVCFETVTGANLGGVDHSGRIFLALSLMSRYKKTDFNKIDKKYLLLLNAKKIKEAIILGACMRLGAMLSVNIKENLRKTKIYTKENIIYLKLIKEDNLLGDSVEKRFNHLGNLMNLKSKIILV